MSVITQQTMWRGVINGNTFAKIVRSEGVYILLVMDVDDTEWRIFEGFREDVFDWQPVTVKLISLIDEITWGPKRRLS